MSYLHGTGSCRKSFKLVKLALIHEAEYEHRHARDCPDSLTLANGTAGDEGSFFAYLPASTAMCLQSQWSKCHSNPFPLWISGCQSGLSRK